MTGSIETKVEQRIDSLLKEAIDPRVPSGPSIAPRGINHVELLQQASQAGFAAVATKDHDYSGVMTAALIKKHASLNDVKGIAAMGAFVEHSLCTFLDRAGSAPRFQRERKASPKPNAISHKAVREWLKKGGRRDEFWIRRDECNEFNIGG